MNKYDVVLDLTVTIEVNAMTEDHAIERAVFIVAPHKYDLSKGLKRRYCSAHYLGDADKEQEDLS